ncbi:MAG: hypothetical protein ABRQ37_16730 [Candidatus Eremiobacterota bacterium]
MKIKPGDINNFKSNEQLKAYQAATSIISETDDIIKRLIEVDDKADIDFNKGKGDVMMEAGYGIQDAHLVYNPDTKEANFLDARRCKDHITMKTKNGLFGLGDPSVVIEKENSQKEATETVTVNKKTNVITYNIDGWADGIY